MDLKGLTVPVKLTGPFTSPQYKIDFSRIAASAAKAVVETKTEEVKAKVQEKVQEQLGGKLKGLFGK